MSFLKLKKKNITVTLKHAELKSFKIIIMRTNNKFLLSYSRSNVDFEQFWEMGVDMENI